MALFNPNIRIVDPDNPIHKTQGTWVTKHLKDINYSLNNGDGTALDLHKTLKFKAIMTSEYVGIYVDPNTHILIRSCPPSLPEFPIGCVILVKFTYSPESKRVVQSAPTGREISDIYNTIKTK